MRKVKTRKSIKKEDYEDLVYYKLKNSRFKQQRLPAWRPVPTICSIIVFYISFGIIFIGIGIVLLLFSHKIIKLEIPYNYQCKDEPICRINPVTVKENMNRPIMIYYKLDGFFQNHRRYVRSKSQKQLYGDETTLEEMKDDGDCDPVFTNRDMGLNSNISINGEEFNMDDVAIPCGLMAKTYFNDNFINWTINNESFIPNEKDIAWPKDKELYKNSNKSRQWVDIEDEHFIVWMRPSGLPNFTKLWGRIDDRDLEKGQSISFIVENNYNVSHYGGDKIIILSTTNEFGGKNLFLGTSYIVVGGISIFLGIAFPLLLYQRNKNEDLKKNL